MQAYNSDHVSFARLLKSYREAAFLSQEALAIRAGISVRAISDLERGIKLRPHNDTLALLVQALALTDEQAAIFRAGARRKSPVAGEPNDGRGQSPVQSPSPGIQTAPTEESRVDKPHPGPLPGALPLALTSFIGREQEQATVRRLLGDCRLVTLIGAGGCGKTRLALQVAGAMAGFYPDGVFMVDLAAVADPDLAHGAVIQVLGVREEPGLPVLEVLVSRLREKYLLLVLDNCEHLIDACAELATILLRDCPQVRLLAASREELAVAGEQLYRVPSLSLPPPANRSLTEISSSEAVRLFVERAQAHAVDFELTPANAASVVEICARLDGIPLAIELAAARVPILSAQSIAARLDDCFRLLTGGPRTVLPRQQTLRAAMDWSYDLLGDPERMLLHRLSVFAGGWTLDAAEAICSDPPIAHAVTGADLGDVARGEGAASPWDTGLPPAGLETGEVLDLLAQLVSRSLVVAEDQAVAARYRLLEIVRQYAHQRLQARREATLIQERHARYYLALADEAEPALIGPDQLARLAQLTIEHDNMRIALQWARQTGAIDLGLRLAGALWRFWQVRGYMSEGRQWLEDLSARAERLGGSVSASVRAKAYDGAGALARIQGDYEGAAALCERGLQLRRDSDDRMGIATSLNSLGLVSYKQAAYDQAVAFFEESLSVHRELGDTVGIANVLNNLGMVADDQGSYQPAASFYEASLALFRELGNLRNCANALNNLGAVRVQQGDNPGALQLFEESLDLFAGLEDRRGMALVLEHLGEAAARQHQLRQAAAYHRRSLALAQVVGDRELIAWNLQGLAAVVMLSWQHATAADAGSIAAHTEIDLSAPSGWPLQAARLFGAAAALRAILGAPLPPAEQPWYDRLILEARQALGPEIFARAWAAGQALPQEEAIAYALTDIGC